MAVPIFNPGPVPNLGGASSAQSEANTQLRSGLSGLGTSITGLGARLEQRNKDKIDRANQQGKEILETLLANATTEEEFNSIAQEFAQAADKNGFVLPGQAEAIAARRRDLLANRGTRLDHLGKEQTTRLTSAQADLAASNAEMGAVNARYSTNGFNVLKDFGNDFARVQALAAKNSPELYPAIEALNEKITADPNFGEKYVGYNSKAFWEEALGLQTTGSTTRTGLDDDITKQRENKTTRTKSAIEESTAVRTEQERIRAKAVAERYAEYKNKATSNENLADIVNNDPYFTYEEKVNLLSDTPEVDLSRVAPLPENAPSLTEILNQNPLLNPGQSMINSTLNMFLGGNRPTNESAIPDPERIVAALPGQIKALDDRIPAHRIYDQAAKLDEAGAYDGVIGNVGVVLRKQLKEDYHLADNEVTQIERMMEKYGLTNSETAMLVSSSLKEDDTPFGWFNKPELDDDKFKKLAKAYAEEKPLIESRRASDAQLISTANALKSKIDATYLSMQRALAKGDTAAAAEYRKKASTYENQLNTIDKQINTAVTRGDPEAIAKSIRNSTNKTSSAP